MKKNKLDWNKKNKRLKLFFHISFLVMLIGGLAYLGSLSGENAQAAPNSTIYFDPSSLTVNQSGTFSLDAVINPGTNQVYGVDVYVDFDQTRFQMTGISANSSVFPVTLQSGSYNNATGTAAISLATGISNPPSVTSSTTVATFDFQAIGPGESPISFLGSTIAVAKNEAGDVITTRTPAVITVNTRTYTIADFQNLVNHWMQNISGSPADINADNVVNSRDLGIMMTYWGSFGEE